MVYFIAALDII